MRPRHAIASSLHLFTVLSFFAVGFFFFALPLLPEVRIRMADFLLNRFELCTPIAVGCFLAAFLLLIGFYGLDRGKFLRIEMGQNLASIEAPVIRETLEECFKKHFPRQISLTDIEILGGKKLEIGVTISSLDEEAREELFIHAERALQTVLVDRFGYLKPFYLIVRSTE
jgi:hypothetical protein